VVGKFDKENEVALTVFHTKTIKFSFAVGNFKTAKFNGPLSKRRLRAKEKKAG